MDGEREKSQPWHEEELLWCAGYHLIYHTVRGVIDVVYLPGGLRVPVDDLKAIAEANKLTFCLPSKVRGARGVTRVKS